MKINESLLKFPSSIPNDIEGLMFIYPWKFPGIVSYYQEVAKEIAVDYKKFIEYGNWAHDELFKGFDKIKKDYDAGDKEDLSFLVEIDQRLHKLFCYRFWIVNYLFPDGPVHDFYVTALRDSIRKFVDVGDEIEDFESRVVQIQRDLLQSDYADLYLRQALSGVKLIEILRKNENTNEILEKNISLVSNQSPENIRKINLLWDSLIELIKEDKTDHFSELNKELSIPFIQASFRKTMQPVYNMLTHAVEFREENVKLSQRHEGMSEKISSVFDIAKLKLSTDEYELFETSYNQIRNFTIYKDIMGEIDELLLPMWFGLLDKCEEIMSKKVDIPRKALGPARMFYKLVWFLPTELKGVVMTPDYTPFDSKTI